MPRLSTRAVPLVDLARQHDAVAVDVLPPLLDAMARGHFIGGAAVTSFEAAYARFSERRHCVGVANGTDAVELMLRAAGIGPGDDVIVPTNTFVATAAAVVRAGARPVLVDCDPDHLLIDVPSAAEHLGPRTRAVLAVHLFGQLAPVETLAPLAASAGAALLEDAAQCHGATRHLDPPGSWGLAAATSFYPGKNLGAYGDGGAVVTDDEEFAGRLRALRNHGGEQRYEHRMIGWNSRLDALQAIVLEAKLRHLPDWNLRRARAAARYHDLLGHDDAVRLPGVLAGNDHVWHLYVVRVPERDRVLAELQAAGIAAGIHYPTPVHLLPAFGHLGYREGDFPNAERAAAEILSLPLFPGMTDEEIEYVAATLLQAVHR